MSQVCRRTSWWLQHARHDGWACNSAQAIVQECRPQLRHQQQGIQHAHLPTRAAGRMAGHARVAGHEGSKTRRPTEKPPFKGRCQNGWTCQSGEAAGPPFPSSKPLLHHDMLPDRSGKKCVCRTLPSWAAARKTVPDCLDSRLLRSACLDFRPTLTLSLSGVVKRLLS